MNAQQAIAKWLETEGAAQGVTASDFDADYHGDTDAILAIWTKENPAPVFVKDSYGYAVEAAMYAIRREEAIYIVNGDEFPLSVEFYRWNVQQAIINRKDGVTMLAAAYAYTDQLLQNI